MHSTLSLLGKNIRQYRMAKGWSQKSLAKLLRVDKAYISRVENGKKNLTIGSVEKLANALTVDVQALFK
jgi:transcriptional regulator with XRE-family HTH domain